MLVVETRINRGSMYAETDLMFPDFQYLSQEVQQLDDLWRSHRSNVFHPVSNLVQPPTISDYYLGGEGDLFKAPEPIIEEPALGLDPMTAAISMFSCGEDVISPQTHTGSTQAEQLMSDVFYECKKDILEKESIDVLESKLCVEGSSFQKSVSSECLMSMDWMAADSTRPNFLDFPGAGLDGGVYGIRRSFSEGDIKTLGNGNASLIHSSLGLSACVETSTTEVRMQKLSRYRNKKNKRNFGRKIKYACRKALADSQPRVHGRFAKTEESDIPKK